jgi:hypothetical protein
VYRADADEAITGTASKYVRITPAGASASAAYVSSLAGVSWNNQYNGYYDASGNLYIFDESRALYDGAVATVKTRFVHQQENGDVYIKTAFIESGNLKNAGQISAGDVVVPGTFDRRRLGNSRADEVDVYEVICPFSGSLRISFSARFEGGAGPGEVKIKKNGSSLLTQSVTTGVTFTQDINVLPGDSISVSVRRVGIGDGFCSIFRPYISVSSLNAFSYLWTQVPNKISGLLVIG